MLGDDTRCSVPLCHTICVPALYSHARAEQHHLMKLSANTWRSELEFSQTVRSRGLSDGHLSGFCPNHFYAGRGTAVPQKNKWIDGFLWPYMDSTSCPPPLLNQRVMAQEHEHRSPTSVMMCECAWGCCLLAECVCCRFITELTSTRSNM